MCSRLGEKRPSQYHGKGQGRRSKVGALLLNLPTWLYQHCLAGPKNCARSPTDESSITAVQAGKHSRNLAFFQCWFASTRICVRFTVIGGWSRQHFYGRAKEKDPYLGGIMNKKRGVHQSAPPQHSPRYTFPGLKLCYTGQEEPVQAVLRQQLNANFLFFSQNTALLHFRTWSGLQNCQYIQLIHCDIGIQQKGSLVYTEGLK